jgi:metal-sulfur cluster biosynthetic enzyme
MSLSPAPDHARANPLVSSTTTDQPMHSAAASDLGSDLDQVTILERLNEVLDPGLDESIVELGFIRSIVRRGVHVHVVLALPTRAAQAQALSIRARLLLFFVAVRIEWERAGITRATVTTTVVKGLIERDVAGGLTITKQGRAVLAALLVAEDE